MATDIDYALLATKAYGGARDQINSPGWERVLGSDLADGFSGSVYKNNAGEYVISFRGTDDPKDIESWATGISKYAPQLYDAIGFVA